MNDNSGIDSTVWQRLKQRKLFQWLLAYCACAMAAAQLFAMLSDSFAWPGFVMRGMWVIIGVGLAVAVVIAWYHGERGQQRVTGPELLMLAILTMVATGVLWLVAQGMPIRAEPHLQTKAANDTSSDFLASVAVLPFQTLTADPRNNYLGDAVSEEITAQLGQVKSLKVISRTSVLRFRGLEISMPAIADTLDVRNVVEGTIVIQPNNPLMRITVQLIDAPRDVHIEARVWTADQGALFTVQEEIAEWVVESLLSRVYELRSAGNGSRTKHLSAYEAFVAGKMAATTRTQEGLQRSIAHLEKAIELDPDYALPYASLATVYGLWGTYGYAGEPDTYAAFARALGYATRAIELDPNLAEAYSARAYLLSKSWAPAAQVEADFIRALQLRPSSADVRSQYAHFLTREQRFTDALAEAERAIALDPVAPGRDVGLAYDALAARQYSLAIRAAEHANDHEPSLKLPGALRAMALVLSGRPADCEVIQLDGHPGIRAACLASLNRVDQAGQVMDSIGRGAVNSLAAQQLAIHAAWSGDTEAALRWLERSYARSPNGLDFRMISSGVFDRVMSDGNFNRGFAALQREIWKRVQTELGKRPQA